MEVFEELVEFGGFLLALDELEDFDVVAYVRQVELWYSFRDTSI